MILAARYTVTRRRRKRLEQGQKGQGLGLVTGSTEKTESKVTGNFQSRLGRCLGEPLVPLTVQRKKGNEQGVQKTVQPVTRWLRGQVKSLPSLQVTELGK